MTLPQLREEQARRLEELNKESEQLQEIIMAERSKGGQTVGQAQSELAAAQKEYNDFLSTSKAEQEGMHRQLVSELDVLTDHKQRIEQQLKELNEYLGVKLTELDEL